MVSRATLLAARRSVAPLSPSDADGSGHGAGAPSIVAPLRSLTAAYAARGGLAAATPPGLTLIPVPGEEVELRASSVAASAADRLGGPNVANRVHLLSCLTVRPLGGPAALLEAGPEVSHDMAKLGRLLEALGPLDAPAVARCVGAFAMEADARSADAPPPPPRLPLAELLDVVLGGGSLSEDATRRLTGEMGGGGTLDVAEWNVDNFVAAVSAPARGRGGGGSGGASAAALDWDEVIAGLDRDGFAIASPRGLGVLLKAYRAGKGNPSARLPGAPLVGDWAHPRAQLTLLAQVLSAGDAAADFSGLTPRTAPVDGVESWAGEVAWSAVPVVETLLNLAARVDVEPVRVLFTAPLEVAPEVLLLGLAAARPTFVEHKAHFLSALIPVTLNAFPNKANVVRRLWATDTSLVISGMVSLWRSSPGAIARVLDIVHELKALQEVLRAARPFEFSIELAVLAARREYLNLSKWVLSRVDEHSTAFAVAVLGYLADKAGATGAGTSGPPPSASPGEPPAPLFSVEASAILLNCLQSRLSVLPPGGIDDLKRVYGLCVRAHPRLAALLDPAASTDGSGGEGAPSPAGGATSSSSATDGPGGGAGEGSLGTGPVGPGDGADDAGMPSGVGFAPDTEREANLFFESVYTGATLVASAVDSLRSLARSPPGDHAQEVFRCIVHTLFDEYRFFHSYPEPELRITGVLFGALIQHGLILGPTLELALRFMLEALHAAAPAAGSPPGTPPGNMAIFAGTALGFFRARLAERPPYVAQLLHASRAVSGALPPRLLADMEAAAYASAASPLAAAAAPPSGAMAAGGGDDAPVGGAASPDTTSPARPVSSGMAGLYGAGDRPPAGPSRGLQMSPPAAPASASSSTTPARSSTGQLRPSTSLDGFPLATVALENILKPAGGDGSTVVMPDEAVQDKVHFLFNNLTPMNVATKANELRDLLSGNDTNVEYLAHYVVVKRASIEANNHDLYVQLLEALSPSLPKLLNIALAKAFANVRVLLTSDDKIRGSLSERQLLKNLGAWIGLLTLARNKPIRAKDLDVKRLIFDAYATGRLIAVIPFVAKVLVACARSKVFRPSNPWVRAILCLLKELYALPDLKLNLKFEVSSLCKRLSISLDELPATDSLRDKPTPSLDGNPDFALQTAATAAATAVGASPLRGRPSPSASPEARAMQPSSAGLMSGMGGFMSSGMGGGSGLGAGLGAMGGMGSLSALGGMAGGGGLLAGMGSAGGLSGAGGMGGGGAFGMASLSAALGGEHSPTRSLGHGPQQMQPMQPRQSPGQQYSRQQQQHQQQQQQQQQQQAGARGVHGMAQASPLGSLLMPPPQHSPPSRPLASMDDGYALGGGGAGGVGAGFGGKLSAAQAVQLAATAPPASAAAAAAAAAAIAASAEGVTVIPNLAQHILVSPSLGLFQANPALKRLLPVAVDRAVREIIQPVVERSCTIACITTRELVIKDFSATTGGAAGQLTGDNETVRKAAHQMVQHLAGSLALVTCKEPLRASMGNHLRNLLTSSTADAVLLDQTVQTVCADNLDVGCAIIERAATEKAASSIDDAIAPALALRRPQPGMQQPLPHHMTASDGSIRVYGDFSRQPVSSSPPVQAAPQASVPSPPSGAASSPPSRRADKTGAAGGQASSSAGIATGQVEDASSLTTPTVLERFNRAYPELLHAVADAGAVGATSMSALPADHDVVRLTSAIPMWVRRCVTADEAGMAVAQKVFQRLYERDSHLHRDVHVSILEGLRETCRRLPRELVSWLAYSDGVRARDRDATVALLRPHNLLNLTAFDELLTKNTDSGRHAAATDFAAFIVQRCIIDEPLVTPAELSMTLDVLAKLGRRSPPPSIPAASTAGGLLPLVTKARAVTTPPQRERSSTTAVAAGSLAGGGVSATDGAAGSRSFASLVDTSPAAAAAAGIDDTPRTRQDVALLLDDWARVYAAGSGARALPEHVVSAHVSQAAAALDSDVAKERFFRLGADLVCATATAGLSARHGGAVTSLAQAPYASIDAFSKLVVLLTRVFASGGGTAAGARGVSALHILLSAVVRVIVRTHRLAVEDSSLDLRPHFRLFSNILNELTPEDGYDNYGADGKERDSGASLATGPGVEVVSTASFQVLATVAGALEASNPLRAPAFAYGWLELLSHRGLLPRLLNAKLQKGWPIFERLLVQLLTFLAPHLQAAVGTELPSPIRVLYRGTLRVLLMLLHDFPEFLCAYHFALCDVMTPRCIQLRNLVLSAFPRNMRLPDPFLSDLKFDQLPEMAAMPLVLSNVTAALSAVPVAGDFSLHNALDEVLGGRAPVARLDLPHRLLSAVATGVANGTGGANGATTAAGESRWNISAIHSVVLYTGRHFLSERRANRGTGSISSGPHADVLRTLVLELDAEGRYHALNGIANQLRYPNSHTHYFSCVLLLLFSEVREEVVKEQITRVLVERLIANRPHPWGLLITFVELIKNPTYSFWRHSFVTCAPEIQRLFRSVANSCCGSPPAGVGGNTGGAGMASTGLRLSS